MAARARRLATNAAGDFFVDSSCIDCGTCNWVAPASFDDGGDGHSRVYRQPRDEAETRRAEMAVVACPVGAIGAEAKRDFGRARAAFPERIDGPVHHCGYHAEASFGAASYLILRESGNILVDSPRFARPLVERIAALGGVRTMFLTHRDDVADHAKFRDHFGCERVIHARDAVFAPERTLDGVAPVDLAPGAIVIPVPGHTAGSCCLLVDGKYLFSGDHAAFDPARGHVYAFRDACWHDWRELQRSMRRLAGYDFEYLLPGHGHPCHFPKAQMRLQMQRCLDRMAAA